MTPDDSYNQVDWVLQAPWGRVGLALGVVVCVALIALAWLTNRRLPLRRRIAAFVARTVAVVCGFILFVQPSIEFQQVEYEANAIAVAIDNSLSMSLPSSQKGEPRIEVVKKLLADSARTFATWKDRNHKVEFFTFASDLEPSSPESLQGTSASGAQTRFSHLLSGLAEHYRGRGLGGVVILSDGTATDEYAGPGQLKELTDALGAPIHTVWMARDDISDVAIARIMADEFAFVRTVVPLEVVISSSGKEPRSIPVTLRVDGQKVQEKTVNLAAGRSEERVRFEYTPSRVGKFVFQVETPVGDDEAVPTNNSDAVLIRVLREKIRVLHVAGAPSWDVRALRGILKQNPNVDLISFFILRTLFDISASSQNELSLIQFPTHELFAEELPSFDVVILQNFDYAPYGMAQYLENIRAYVADGGGLFMIGGEGGFESGGYADTPLADVLPLDLAPADPKDPGEYRPVLTELGRVHPVTQLRGGAASNVLRWQSLPAFSGVNVTLGTRADAATLLTHPSLLDTRRRPLPVLSAMDAGKGRSLALLTDSLWRWWFSTDADSHAAYENFWENAIRWVTRDPDFERLHVSSDEVVYSLDTPVRVHVRVLDWDYTRKADAPVQLELRKGPDPRSATPVQEIEVKTGEDGQVDAELGLLPPGVYRVVARTDEKGQTLEATELFSVRAGQRELREPNPDPALLEEIAQISGGQFMDLPRFIPSDLSWRPPRVARIERRSRVELWSGLWVLSIALLALGFEWGLRQRSGYL